MTRTPAVDRSRRNGNEGQAGRHKQNHESENAPTKTIRVFLKGNVVAAPQSSRDGPTLPP